MSDSFDLDAADAEANGARFQFTSHGVTYEMETGEDCDWRVIDALDKGELATAMRYLMGQEQYAKFTAHKVTARGLKTLLSKWMAFKGDDVGEGLASPNS